MEKEANRHSRFTLRELFLLLLVVAVALGWWLDHTRLIAQYTVDYPARETAATLTMGMNQDEVRAAMGKPHKDYMHGGTQLWLYYFDEKQIDRVFVSFGKNKLIQGIGTDH